MTPRRTARAAALTLLFVGLVVAAMRPHPGRFPSDPGDPAFVAWAMSWTVHAALHHPLHLLDANIFWPRHATLAYSDLLTPMVPVYSFFHFITGSWENAVTLTEMALLVFAMGTTFGFTRWLTGRADVAVFAAIAVALNGYVLSQLSHLQLYTIGFVVLAFWLLFRVLEKPTVARAVAAAAAIAAVLYASLYYGLAVAVGAALVAIGALWGARRSADRRPLVRALAITAVTSVLLVAPASAAYLRAQHETGFTRGIDPQWGLRARDLVTPAPHSYVWGPLARRNVPADAEHRFFAGFSTYALAAVGIGVLVATRRRLRWRGKGADESTARQPFVGLLALAGVGALVLALGPVVAGHWAPFRFFHDVVPGFGAVRAVARFAVVTLLAIGVLAAVGLAWLTQRLSPRNRVVVCGIASALLFAELAAPLRWQGLEHGPNTLAVYRELATKPAGAVAELPMADHYSPPGAWAGTEAKRMLFSTFDWNPRVNGYSGLAPPGYARDANVLNTFPSDAALARLSALQVRYVIWHPTGSVLARPLPTLPTTIAALRVGNAWFIELP